MALTWIPWDVAVASGAVVGTAGVAGRASRKVWITKIAAFARELAIVLVLYAMWRLVATISVMKVNGAINAGESIWDWERMLLLPNERSLQNLFMHSSPLVQLCNWYYASLHIPSMLAFLVWLWVRHRDVYPPIRNVIALTTLWCLAIQLIPVAPPRLVPSLHVQDTPALFGQTVYPSFGKDGPAQLSAMPSVHVGWAVIIGIAIVIASKSKWRWVFLAHPVLTMLVVVVTGNHYWLDGIVAVFVIALAVPFESWARRSVSSRFGTKVSSNQRAPSQMPIRSMTEASSE
jgi:hypothetical protein